MNSRLIKSVLACEQAGQLFSTVETQAEAQAHARCFAEEPELEPLMIYMQDLARAREQFAAELRRLKNLVDTHTG